MKLHLPDREINSFTVMYRDDTVQGHNYEEILSFIKYSEAHSYTGLLLFESNRGNLEPWIISQEILSKTDSLSPFIAINPVYMHPFLAAKKISILSNIYKRKLFLNFITGTSQSDLNNMSSMLEHDQRYARLVEYIKIVDLLLKGNKPLNFAGEYYNISNLILSSKLPSHLLPEYYIAGSSEAAEKSRLEVNALKAIMGKDVLNWQNEELLPSEGKAVHFGMIARGHQKDADQVLDEWLDNRDNMDDLFKLSMRNTDGKWKNDLATEPDSFRSTFNLKPLRSLKSDCPYYVTSYEECANILIKYILNGFNTIIIEIPIAPQEFEHIEIVFKIAENLLLKKFYKSTDESFQFKF